MPNCVVDSRSLEDLAKELAGMPESEKLMLLGFLRDLKAGWIPA